MKGVAISVVLLLVALWTPIGFASNTSSNGVMNLDGQLVYSMNFEGVTRKSSTQLNWGSNINVVYSSSTNATNWLEGVERYTPGVTCHTGSECLGLEVNGTGYRSEFAFYPTLTVQDQYFLSVWQYLPPGWTVHYSPPPHAYYELGDPMFTGGPDYRPYWAIRYAQVCGRTVVADFPSYDLVLVYQNSTDSYCEGDIPAYNLPVGSWFNLQWYVYRSTTNGIVMVWINNNLLFNLSGVVTQNATIASWNTTPFKVYHDRADVGYDYKEWFDDLQIYNGLPSSMQITTSVTTSTTSHASTATTTPVTTVSSTSSSTTHTSSTTTVSTSSSRSLTPTTTTTTSSSRTSSAMTTTSSSTTLPSSVTSPTTIRSSSTTQTSMPTTVTSTTAPSITTTTTASPTTAPSTTSTTSAASSSRIASAITTTQTSHVTTTVVSSTAIPTTVFMTVTATPQTVTQTVTQAPVTMTVTGSSGMTSSTIATTSSAVTIPTTTRITTTTTPTTTTILTTTITSGPPRRGGGKNNIQPTSEVPVPEFSGMDIASFLFLAASLFVLRRKSS